MDNELVNIISASFEGCDIVKLKFSLVINITYYL